MKRVAICLSGQFRSVYYTLENIKQFWKKYFEDYDDTVLIDYFIYGSNKITCGYNASLIYKIPYSQDVSEERINYIESILNPIKFEIDYDEESYYEYIKDFYKDNKDVTEFLNESKGHCQFFYSQGSINLKIQHEKENNFEYDVTIWHRLDLYFNINNINPNKYWNDSNFNNSIYFTWKWEENNHIMHNDMFAFGKTNLINKFYKNICYRLLQQTPKYINDPKLRYKPESWIQYALYPDINISIDIWIAFEIFRDLTIYKFPKYITNNLTYENIKLISNSFYVYSHIFEKICKKFNLDYKQLSNILYTIKFNIFNYIILNEDSEKNLYNLVEYIINQYINEN